MKDNEKDQYGSVLRESLKRSMEQPANGNRPLNRTPGHQDHFLARERRRRWFRRLWWHHKETFVILAWGLMWLGFGMAAWLMLNQFEGAFR